jgi:hypothetical protein
MIRRELVDSQKSPAPVSSRDRYLSSGLCRLGRHHQRGSRHSRPQSTRKAPRRPHRTRLSPEAGLGSTCAKPANYLCRIGPDGPASRLHWLSLESRAGDRNVANSIARRWAARTSKRSRRTLRRTEETGDAGARFVANQARGQRRAGHHRRSHRECVNGWRRERLDSDERVRDATTHFKPAPRSRRRIC